MLAYILIALATVIGVILVAASLKPSAFRIERSIQIAAPPSAVFPFLNDLRKANSWNPWVRMDPAGTFTFDGPAAGVGAVSSWAGGKIGQGRQTIMESVPFEKVTTRLEFLKPVESIALAVYDLKPQGTQTRVTWSLSGANGFMWKLMGLVVKQDKMIGGQFEKGLASLKLLSETGRVGSSPE
jgi:hypothetical protein